MQLTDLEPEFIKRLDDRTSRYGVSMAEADGINFLCPKCFAANGGSIGTHHIICYRPHVPANVRPGPGRWEMQGHGMSNLTLVAGSSSVHLTGPGCGAHFFIRNGAIEMC